MLAITAAEIAAAKSNGDNDEAIKVLEQRGKSKQEEIETKLAAAKAYSAGLVGKVGAFEGAGYMAKGMYRSQVGCWMGAAGPSDGFCVVCQQSIKQMINYYAPDPPANGQ